MQAACSENVKWFSSRSVGADKEMAQLDLASVGLYSVTVKHQVKVIAIAGVEGLTGEVIGSVWR